MSIWMCPSCKTLTGPECGPCPKCGTPTHFATVTTSVAQDSSPALDMELGRSIAALLTHQIEHSEPTEEDIMDTTARPAPPPAAAMTGAYTVDPERADSGCTTGPADLGPWTVTTIADSTRTMAGGCGTSAPSGMPDWMMRQPNAWIGGPGTRTDAQLQSGEAVEMLPDTPQVQALLADLLRLRSERDALKAEKENAIEVLADGGVYWDDRADLTKGIHALALIHKRDRDALLASQAQLQTQIQALKEWLVEALSEWEYSAKYKGDYLMEKHGDVTRITEIRAAALLGERRSPPRE